MAFGIGATKPKTKEAKPTRPKIDLDCAEIILGTPFKEFHAPGGLMATWAEQVKARLGRKEEK